MGRPAQAITLLRDPDIEFALKQLAAPILKAAGLGASRMDILLIDDRRLNAFVIDRNNIFIHSGLLLRMQTPEMLQAVLAHEAAHIANGHLVRRPVNARNAATAAGIGVALAVAAAAAGAGEAAGAAALGVQSSAQRRFFAHTRAEENAADQSGLRYMATAGIDPQGAVAVMDIFRGQEVLSRGRQDPYARTHPLSADRYRVVKRLAAGNAGRVSDNKSAKYWFARAKGKLSAFQRTPKWTLTRAGEFGFADVKHMREAIAHHRNSKLKKALNSINKAIAGRPNDPFYQELKGQILFENRQFSAAGNTYARAANLAPRNALIVGALGRAQLAIGQTGNALQSLERSRALDARDVRVVRDLSQAYAKSGNRGMASLTTAERYAMTGRLKDASIHAKRASDLLPRGSTGWRRSQDILAVAKSAGRKR